MNVKRQLVSGDYVKALAVLKAAVVTWPDYEMFKTGAEADGEKSTHESEENRYLTFKMKLHLADFSNFIQQTCFKICLILGMRKKQPKIKKTLLTEK